MTIYIDQEFRCHSQNNGSMRAVETNFFNGKCVEFIEGYRLIPAGESWTNEDGFTFSGEMISPWKPYNELENAQRKYEKEQLADMKVALELLGVSIDE